MSLSRRALLGAALGGGSLAALGGMPAWAAGGGTRVIAPSDRLVLVARGADPSFAASAAQGARVMEVEGMAGLSDAARWLSARPGRRLVGLLTEADGLVLRQLVPAGCDWLAFGHHREGGEGGFHSRHQIAMVPASRGLARRLAADLAAQARDFSVTEAGVTADPRDPVVAAARASDGWEAALGDALGRIATGRWRPDQVAPAQAFSGRGSRRSERDIALTSFVVAG